MTRGHVLLQEREFEEESSNSVYLIVEGEVKLELQHNPIEKVQLQR